MNSFVVLGPYCKTWVLKHNQLRTICLKAHSVIFNHSELSCSITIYTELLNNPADFQKTFVNPWETF